MIFRISDIDILFVSDSYDEESLSKIDFNDFDIPYKLDFALIENGDYEICFYKAYIKFPITIGGSVDYWKVDKRLEIANKFKQSGGVIYRGPIEIPNSCEGRCLIKDLFGNVIGLQREFKNE